MIVILKQFSCLEDYKRGYVTRIEDKDILEKHARANIIIILKFLKKNFMINSFKIKCKML